jgi:hypothetical protein
MTTNTKLLVIAGVTVNTDEEGRYCLNDLHKAAGGADKHKVLNFIRLDSTRELVDELNCSEVSSKKACVVSV